RGSQDTYASHDGKLHRVPPVFRPSEPRFHLLHGGVRPKTRRSAYKFAPGRWWLPLCSLPRNRLGFCAMESQAVHLSILPPPDRRQSETALAIARGTARLLRSLGFSCISELPLPSGRRADLVALNERGEIWIVEIKSSIEDLRADQKWQDYRAHCDRL